MVVRAGFARRTILKGALAAPFVVSAKRMKAKEAPSRVVSMELLLTELLLTLGVEPLAVANVPLYRRLVAEPALSDGVADLGPLQEPNTEYLQLLKPDLIVMAEWQANGLENLKRIAPVATLNSFAGKIPAVLHAQNLLREMAGFVGREEEAEGWIARCEVVLADAGARLHEKSPLRPLYLCRFNQDGRHAAIFGGNGLVGDVLARLGLQNAWEGRVNASGVASIGIEQLAGNPEARIVHFDRGRETGLAMERLAESPLWNALPAVRKGRITSMPVIYPSGGVRSAMRLAAHLADLLPAKG
ncbi:MAG: ABC transporter substrate-binding protein [Shinella sp.]|nr:ABC transporter substrate-binding protein [Shinella sp.]